MFIIFSFFHNFAYAGYTDDSEKLIVVHGKSKSSANRQIAKDQAIRDAFLTALTKKIEHLISVEKFELHYELIHSNILAKASSYIKRFLLRNQEIVNNHLQVEIHLSIDDEKLRESLASIGLLFARKDYYKGLLMISIKSTVDPSPDFWWGEKDLSQENNEIYRDIISKSEITKPIVMIDPFEMAFRDKIPGNLKKLYLSDDEIQAIGKVLSIDIIFFGNLATRCNRTSQGIKYLETVSSFQAMNVNTGRVISHTNYRGKGHTSFKDSTRNENKLITGVAVNNLRKSTKNIISTWVNGTYNSISYRLVLRGLLDYREYSLLKYFLKNDIKSITSVSDYIVGRSQKTLIIESNRSLSDVRKELSTARMENFQLEPNEIEQEDLHNKRFTSGEKKEEKKNSRKLPYRKSI